MIMAIQRIRRYMLLLREILEPALPERLVLSSAMDAVQEIANGINEANVKRKNRNQS